MKRDVNFTKMLKPNFGYSEAAVKFFSCHKRTLASGHRFGTKFAPFLFAFNQCKIIGAQTRMITTTSILTNKKWGPSIPG